MDGINTGTADHHFRGASQGAHTHSSSPVPSRAYRHLIWMGLAHLPLMYFIMFTMVYSWDEVVHNLNTFYMAGMMVAPMLIVMPLMMSHMYPSRRMNWLVYGFSIVLFAVLFLFMRNQTFIGDRQFLRSMIPHHSGAVLMCEKANLSAPEVKTLCSKIIESQKEEIALMQQLLEKM